MKVKDRFVFICHECSGYSFLLPVKQGERYECQSCGSDRLTLKGGKET